MISATFPYKKERRSSWGSLRTCSPSADVSFVPNADIMQRPGRYKVRDALSMLWGQRALRNGRPPHPRQTPRLRGECCRPNR